MRLLLHFTRNFSRSRFEPTCAAASARLGADGGDLHAINIADRIEPKFLSRKSSRAMRREGLFATTPRCRGREHWKPGWLKSPALLLGASIHTPGIRSWEGTNTSTAPVLCSVLQQAYN